MGEFNRPVKAEPKVQARFAEPIKGLLYFSCEKWRFRRKSACDSKGCESSQFTRAVKSQDLTARGSVSDCRQILRGRNDCPTWDGPHRASSGAGCVDLSGLHMEAMPCRPAPEHALGPRGIGANPIAVVKIAWCVAGRAFVLRLRLWPR